MNVSRKYGLVRAIAWVLKALAWLSLLIGLLVAVVAAVGIGLASGSLAGLEQLIRSIGLIAGPLVGLVWFVQLYAFGSVLSLLVDIEENTRLIAVQPAAFAETVDAA